MTGYKLKKEMRRRVIYVGKKMRLGTKPGIPLTNFKGFHLALKLRMSEEDVGEIFISNIYWVPPMCHAPFNMLGKEQWPKQTKSLPGGSGGNILVVTNVCHRCVEPMITFHISLLHDESPSLRADKANTHIHTHLSFRP